MQNKSPKADSGPEQKHGQRQHRGERTVDELELQPFSQVYKPRPGAIAVAFERRVQICTWGTDTNFQGVVLRGSGSAMQVALAFDGRLPFQLSTLVEIHCTDDSWELSHPVIVLGKIIDIQREGERWLLTLKIVQVEMEDRHEWFDVMDTFPRFVITSDASLTRHGASAVPQRRN